MAKGFNVVFGCRYSFNTFQQRIIWYGPLMVSYIVVVVELIFVVCLVCVYVVYRH